MKLKLRHVLLFIIIAILYIFIAKSFINKRYRRDFNQFNSQQIIGKLEYSKIKHHGVAFKIMELEEEFIFYPNTNIINGFHIFYSLAEKGDSIVKKQFSDTLTLIKNGNYFFYTFEKPKE